MTMVKQAVIELILLTVASVGVALAANKIREHKSIELTKNNFDKGSAPARNSVAGTPHGGTPSATGALKPEGITKPTQPVTPIANTAPAKVAPDEIAKAASKKHLEHDFRIISLEEVQRVFDDPQTARGLNLFVDARDEEHFAEGHIPGAMQCFPYEARKCLDRVKAAADGADKVIVYCGGGDCEDSIFMCRELTEAGVPTEAVFLFEGGWKEWIAGGLPTEGAK